MTETQTLHVANRITDRKYTSADVEHLLERVPEKDREGVRKFVMTKAASGYSWNSVRTTIHALARVSKLFRRSMVKAVRDDVVAAMVALNADPEQGGATNARWYVGLTKEYMRFHDRDKALLKLPRNGRRARVWMDPKDVLTREDVARMIAKARDVRDRGLLSVLWDSGARAHEVLALDLGDIEVRGRGKDAVITIWFRAPKTRGTERRVPLWEATPTLKSYLASHQRRTDPAAPLFLSAAGSRLSYSSARDIVKYAGLRAKITKPVGCHKFRHARASDLKRRGVSEGAIRLWMGWTRDSPVMHRYISLDVEAAGDEIAGKLGYKPLPAPAPVKSLEDAVVDTAGLSGLEGKYAELVELTASLKDRLAHAQESASDATKAILADPEAVRVLAEAMARAQAAPKA